MRKLTTAIAAAPIFMASMGAWAPAAAQAEEVFTTAEGREVRLSPVGELSCRELLAKIEEIDATGYRGLRPRPRDASDGRLLDYENAVSTRYYSRCGALEEDRDASQVLRNGLAASHAD